MEATKAYKKFIYDNLNGQRQMVEEILKRQCDLSYMLLVDSDKPMLTKRKSGEAKLDD